MMKHANRLSQMIDQSREQVLAPLLLSPPSASQSQSVVKAYLSSQSSLYRLLAESLREMMPSFSQQKAGEKEAVLKSLTEAWDKLDRIVSLLHERTTLKNSLTLVAGNRDTRNQFGSGSQLQPGITQQISAVSPEVQLEVNKLNRRILELLSPANDPEDSIQDESDQALMRLIGHTPKEPEAKIFFEDGLRPTGYDRNPIDDFRLNLDAQYHALTKSGAKSQRKPGIKSRLTSASKRLDENPKFVLTDSSARRQTPDVAAKLFKSPKDRDIKPDGSHYTFLAASTSEDQLAELLRVSPSKNSHEDDPFRLRKTPLRDQARTDLSPPEDCFKIYKSLKASEQKPSLLNTSSPKGQPSFEKAKLCILMDILQKRFKRTFVRRAKASYQVTLKQLQEELEVQKQRNEMLMNLLGTKKLQGRESAETSVPISEISRSLTDRIAVKPIIPGDHASQEPKESSQRNYLKIKPANDIVIFEAGPMDSVLTDNYPMSDCDLAYSSQQPIPKYPSSMKSAGGRYQGVKKSASANLDSPACEPLSSNAKPEYVNFAECGFQKASIPPVNLPEQQGNHLERRPGSELSVFGSTATNNIFQTSSASNCLPNHMKVHPRKPIQWSTGLTDLSAAPIHSHWTGRSSKQASQLSLGARMNETSLNVPMSSFRRDFFSTADDFRLIHAPRPLQSMDFSRNQFKYLESASQRRSGESYLTSSWEENRSALNLMGRIASGLGHTPLTTDPLLIKQSALEVGDPLTYTQPQKSAVLASKSDFGCNPPLSAEQEHGKKEKRMSSKKNTRECLLGLTLNKQAPQATTPVTPAKKAPRCTGLGPQMRKSCGLKLGDKSQHNKENAGPMTTPAHSSQKAQRGVFRNGSPEVRRQLATSSSKGKQKELASGEKPRKAGETLIK